MQLLSFTFLAAAIAQPVPLPNLPDGFRVGLAGPTGPEISVYMDFLCPDCAGDWPVVNAVMAHYQGKISVTLHSFPLPYHTFAFRAAQGAHAIAAINKTSPAEAVFQYAGMMFANQGDFYGADLTTTQVDAHIAELASTKLGYSSAAVAAGLADDNINEATRISWKHAVSRYSTGTPHYMINDLPVDDQLGNGQLADWIALIDPLLAGAPPRLPKTLARFAKKEL